MQGSDGHTSQEGGRFVGRERTCSPRRWGVSEEALPDLGVPHKGLGLKVFHEAVQLLCVFFCAHVLYYNKNVEICMA